MSNIYDATDRMLNGEGEEPTMEQEGRRVLDLMDEIDAEEELKQKWLEYIDLFKKCDEKAIEIETFKKGRICFDDYIQIFVTKDEFIYLAKLLNEPYKTIVRRELGNTYSHETFFIKNGVKILWIHSGE